MNYLLIALVGVGTGGIFGVFGAGAPVVATPILALALQVPAVAAVASPLPAMLLAGPLVAKRRARQRQVDDRLARLSIRGGLPGTVVGALVSWVLGGQKLLLASELVLIFAGTLFLLPKKLGNPVACERRYRRDAFVLAVSFGIMAINGLLANGGGYLFVPFYVIVLGVSSDIAPGTSAAVVGKLTILTVLLHLAHINALVALAYAAGAVPSAYLAASPRITRRVTAGSFNHAFGFLMAGAGVALISHHYLSF